MSTRDLACDAPPPPTELCKEGTRGKCSYSPANSKQYNTNLPNLIGFLAPTVTHQAGFTWLSFLLYDRQGREEEGRASKETEKQERGGKVHYLEWSKQEEEEPLGFLSHEAVMVTQLANCPGLEQTSVHWNILNRRLLRHRLTFTLSSAAKPIQLRSSSGKVRVWRSSSRLSKRIYRDWSPSNAIQNHMPGDYMINILSGA